MSLGMSYKPNLPQHVQGTSLNQDTESPMECYLYRECLENVFHSAEAGLPNAGPFDPEDTGCAQKMRAARGLVTVHSLSTSIPSLQSYRPVLNDYGPPSLGFSQCSSGSRVPQSKYAELLAIIEELGKEIRPTYAGSKSAMERLKRGIIHARGLVRECLAETERNARS